MSGFIKTTPSGYQKAAILLGELGTSATLEIIDSLHLTTKELHKLRLELQKLGKYNPNDYEQTKRETYVLEELKRYGQMKGIYREVPHIKRESEQSQKSQKAKNAISNINAQDIANVLKTWLND